MFSVSTTLLTVFTLFACKEVNGQCNLPSTGFFVQKLGHYLRNHTVRSVTTDIEDVCRIQCYLGDDCMSYNYHTVSGACDINDSDVIQEPDDLVKQDGHIYVGTENSCASKPCPHYSICKTGVRNPGYKCICKPDRSYNFSLGMENRIIKNSQISASSSYSEEFKPHEARLNNNRSWMPSANGADRWIQVDLLKKHKITAIATQGYNVNGHSIFVNKYKIKYKDDGEDLVDYGKEFELTGNIGENTVVKQKVDPAIFARFIRLYPTEPKQWFALRLELYGGAADCQENE